MSNYYREIPENRKGLVKNKCWKCGSFPVIRESETNYFGDNYALISCPNEECENFVDFNDKLPEVIERWNEKNVCVFENDTVKEIDNCNNCFHKKECRFAREQESKFLSNKVCDKYHK